MSLHLNSPTPPTHLDALTSQSSDTAFAQDLIASRHPDSKTDLDFFTDSASYRPGKDLQHPLNPMRGFMGDRSISADQEPSAPPYDLVYILDAIYHFQPSVFHFLTSVLPVLRAGTGILVYTDILPPADLSTILGQLVLPPLLSVPSKNLVSRPKTLEGYKEKLQKIGYVDVEIQDWTCSVFDGLAAHLSTKGTLWSWVGSLIGRADQSGWKFVAVRARRPGAGEKRNR